jgi:hypothetical protein
MNERPKMPFELANEMLLDSRPSELLREQGKESPSLADYIIGEIDMARVHSTGTQKRP